MSNDQKVIKKFLETRDEKDFLSLYRPHADSLYRMSVYLCDNDKDIALDLLQETWITAISQLESFMFQSKFSTWITGILINKSRNQKRMVKQNDELSELSKVNHNVSTVNLRIDMEAAIKQLPQGFREILILHDMEGYKHKEIAELLNISEGTSKSQLSRARSAMRNCIKDYQYGN